MTRATKKKAIPKISTLNLIKAIKEARNGTNDENVGAVSNMTSKLIFSIISKIPARIGAKVIHRPIF